MTSKVDTDSRHEVVMENGLSSLSESTGTVSFVVNESLKHSFFIVVTLFLCQPTVIQQRSRGHKAAKDKPFKVTSIFRELSHRQ